MTTYPIYKVRTKVPVTFGNNTGQTMHVNSGVTGTLQAKTDNTVVITPSNPTPIVIKAVFNGQTFTFQPKFPVPNGDIKPLILSPSSEFYFLPSIKNVNSIERNSLDFSGHEDLDCDICDKFSNVSGTPTYTVTPNDYESMIDEYKASGTSKTFNDWASTDSLKAKYTKSGSAKPFNEWLNQDSTKNLISAVGNVAAAYLSGQNIGKQDILDKDKNIEKEKKKLGLSPVNFGVGIAIISLLSIGGVIWYKKTH